MKTDFKIPLIAAGVSAFFAAGCKGNVSVPNIIIIIADDLGWGDVGYHNSEIQTPNIDRMSVQGIIFDRFYVCSVSSPTRASLLTGRYPSRYGILTPLGDPPGLPAGTLTLPSLLREKGYDTGISGKWHLGAAPEGRPLNYGFNSSYGYLRGQIDPYTHLYKNGDKTWHRNDVLTVEDGHATDLITDEALRFIDYERDAGVPFFLIVAYSVPHSPIEESEEWTSVYFNSVSNISRRNFAASVTHMDNSIGKILDKLSDLEIEENTLVIFFSDNGGQKSWSSQTEYGGKFKPHDILGNNLPLRDWKGSLYDGALRVPALLVWPKKIKPQKIEQAVSVADILPTLAFITQANIPDDHKTDGINIWPLLNGSSLKEERTMYWRTNNAIACLKGDWKLIHRGKDIGSGKDELYNIKTDPFEMDEQGVKKPAKLLELKEHMVSEFSADK